MGFKVSRLNRLGSRIQIPIPKDELGFVGRECPNPSCFGYFKIRPGTGLTGVGLPCHCPYCGHTGASDTFFTPEQVEYAKSMALRQVSQVLQKSLKRLEFNHQPRRGGFGFGVSLKVTPGRPMPIRRYREKTLETNINCTRCLLDYAIFGLFAFCPDCREHNSRQILEKNLELIEKLIVVAEGLPDADLKRQLIEDALENCVSAFDGFARETCRVRAPESNDPAAAEHISFQNLDRAYRRVNALFGTGGSSWLSPNEWNTARRGFLRRHLLAHRSGVIDEQYVQDSQDQAAIPGRRVVITVAEVRELIDYIQRLGSALVDRLPSP